MSYDSLVHLQSGGFADVILNRETGICFKIFYKKGQENKEFKIAKYMTDLYAKYADSTGFRYESHRVVRYIDYGYIAKDIIHDMYKSVYVNNPKKIKQFLDNYECEEVVPYVSMDYIPGQDGVEFVNSTEDGCLDEQTAAEIMLELLYAVDELHSINLIHRDIKPDNFIISKTDGGRYQVTLIDLGLATVSNSNEHVSSGNINGTRCYIAPEAMRGCVSASSDLYSVGMSFFRLCDSPKEFESCFLKLVSKLIEREPSRRGTVSEAIQALKKIV